MNYKSKRGLPGGVSPQLIGERIEIIKTKNGGFVTADMLVKEAKEKTSPLHGCFTWDDKEAGKLRRLDEARYLLRTITIEVEADDEIIITRAFVSVTDDPIYTTIESALADDDMRENLLSQAKKDLRSFKSKYSQLKELAIIFEAIDNI
jgi:hypothetical protein